MIQSEEGKGCYRHMPKSHFIQILIPKGKPYLWSKSLLTTWDMNDNFSYYYGDVNGKPLQSKDYDSVEICCEELSNGQIFDNFRNRSISHTYIDGTLTLLPSDFLKRVTTQPSLYLSCGIQGIDYLYNSVRHGRRSIPSSLYEVKWGKEEYYGEFTSDGRTSRVDYTWDKVAKKFNYRNDTIVGEDFSFDSYGRPRYCKIKYRSYSTSANPPNWLEQAATYTYTQLGQFNPPTISDVKTSNLIDELLKLIIPEMPLSAARSDSMLFQIYNTLNIPNINNIANVCDLVSIKGQINGIRRSLSALVSVGSIRKKVKTVSDLYLAKRYGVDTTAMDLEERCRWVAQYCAMPPKSVEHNVANANIVLNRPGTTYSVSYTDRWHLYRDPYKIGILKTLGFDPTIANLWDALPYTFVIDWFLKIGDELDRLHQDNVIQTEIKIQSLMSSQTACSSYRGILLAYDANLNISSYFRKKMEVFPDYSIDTTVNLCPARNAWDGLALLVSHK